MTAPNERTARRARGRVVVVGRPDGVDDLPRTVIRARNLFDAVGEVTVATAAEPISAVVVPTDMVRGSEALAAEAIRRIDPSVRLVLLAPPGDGRARAEPVNGFDEVLSGPLSSAALATLGGGDATPVAVPRAADTPEPPLDVGDDADPGGPEPDAGAAETFDPQSPLGDTDLVEAILAEPAGITTLALKLIAEQTSWSDVTLSEEPPEGDGVSCTEVRFGRQRFGTLSTRRAGERELRPWAAWLARWLALDHRYRDFRVKAYQDDLTGAWNRRFYDVFMKRILRQASDSRRAVTILVFDIDDFKHYNDDFGHDAGDEILKETVRLLESVIRSGDRVCRIGGDEFVVIFADPERADERKSNPPETVEEIATRFQDQICQMKFPKLGLDAPGTLTISGGLATYPWDGRTPGNLLHHADQLALQSKKKGKNVITLGPGVGKNQPG